MTFTTSRDPSGTITVSPRNEADQTATIVLCHGLGDSAQGWEDVAENLAAKLPYVKFILPTAKTQKVTMNMGMAMPAWYDITGLDKRSNENCPGIEESQQRILSILRSENDTGIPYNRMVLAGFSQGGALSLYTGMQLPPDVGSLAGIVLMSGYLPHASAFRITSGTEHTPIFHGHGAVDPLVKVSAANESQTHVTEKGATIYKLEIYEGLAHSANPKEIGDVLSFLEECLPAVEECYIKLKDPSEMSVKELKASIQKAGIGSKALGFSEKCEFVELLKNHRAVIQIRNQSTMKCGQFSLGLIRAETGSSYKEHAAPNIQDIYAEVEPDDEFYLQLSSDAPEVVYVDLTVDGTLIQRGHPLYPRRKSKVGVVPVNKSTEVALRFAKAEVVESGERADGACKYWTGQVEATFYGNPHHCIPQGAVPQPSDGQAAIESTEQKECGAKTLPAVAVLPPPPPTAAHFQRPPQQLGATIPSTVAVPPPPPAAPQVIYKRPTNTYYTNSSLASSDVGFVLGNKTAKNQQKGVKSAEGTTALRTHNFKPPAPKKNEPEPKNWDDQTTILTHHDDAPIEKDPEKLGLLALKYCSTIGLIHAGILVKPPNWDVEQLQKKCSKRMREEHARILSQIKVHKFELLSETINGRGEKVVEKKEVELLDLT